MSQNIPSVDLSAASVGTKGSMDWRDLRVESTLLAGRERAHLQVFNDTGCALDITIGGRGFHLPAGGWHTDGIELLPMDSSLTYVVTEVIPNQIVKTMRATYFEPGERVPTVSLGNSPIGISGSVSTTNIQSLTNDGNPAPTSIIEATPSGQGSSSVALNNDASGFIKVLSAGVLRAILNVVRGNSGAGNATITIGDAGDATITTLQGSVQGGQPANVGTLTTGAITGTGANSLDGGAITTDGAGKLSPTKISSDGAAWVTDGSGHVTQTINNGAGAADLGNQYVVSNDPVTQTKDAVAWLAKKSGDASSRGSGRIRASDGYFQLGLNGPNGANGGSLFGTATGISSSVALTASAFHGTADNVPASGVTAGALPAGVTLPAGQVSAGNLASGVKQQNGATVAGLDSAGGGAAGTRIWVGTTDPGGSAAEGDIWINA
jgi:hypothetical protein